MERPTIGQTNVLTTGALAWNEPVIDIPIPDRIRQQTDDNLQLAFDGNSLRLQGAEVARLDIYNTAGQLVMTTRIHSHTAITPSQLPRGIYIARTSTDDDDTTLKFSIQ